jgi:tetratricopeptide (TPR) repeat protein
VRSRSIDLRRAAACAASALWLGFAAEPAAAASAARAALDRRVEQASAALRAGEVERALGELAELVKKAPDDTRALSLYAQALLVAGRFQEAADALDRLRRLDPGAERLDYFRGLAAYRLQDWTRAQQLLKNALAREPDSAVLHLLYGVVLQQQGELDAGEAELARALALDPSLEGQVAYRRGVADVRRGSFGSAARRFGEVGPALPGTALSRSADAFEDWIGGAAGQRALSGFAALGTGYDSNVNLAADDDATRGVGREDAPLGIAEAGVNYRVLDTEQLDVDLGTRGGFRFHFGASDFDLAQTRSSIGLGYQPLDWLRASLGYSFEYLAANYETFRLTHVVEPSLRIAPFDEHPTRVFFRYEPRDYDDEPGTGFESLDRDGTVYRAGIEQSVSLPDFFGFGPSFARAGYQARIERAQGDDFDAVGHQPSLTLGLALPLDMLALVDVRNEWRGFDDPSGQSHRNDRITEVGTGISKAFGRRFSLDLFYRYADRDSDSTDNTIPSSDYERHLFEAVARMRF